MLQKSSRQIKLKIVLIFLYFFLLFVLKICSVCADHFHDWLMQKYHPLKTDVFCRLRVCVRLILHWVTVLPFAALNYILMCDDF